MELTGAGVDAFQPASQDIIGWLPASWNGFGWTVIATKFGMQMTHVTM